MSAPEPAGRLTFRVGPLVNIPPLLLRLGFEPAPVVHAAGLELSELVNPDHRLPYELGGRLLETCAECTQREDFGLLLGQMATPSHLGVAGFLARASSTVLQALEALVDNLDLHEDSGRVTLTREDGYRRFCYQLPLPDVPAIEHVYDLSAAVMCQLMRSLCGPDWNPSEVFLPRRPPRKTSPYRLYYRSAVLFNAENCSILVPEHCLALASPSGDELLFQHIEDEARSLHEAQHNNLMDFLPSALQRGLLVNRCSAPEIADALGLHERSLHRRLQEAGTTFRQELDRVRESLSRQLLKGTSLPVCDIAGSLGYADSSGFIRAFRRWTGASPALWRRQARLH